MLSVSRAHIQLISFDFLVWMTYKCMWMKISEEMKNQFSAEISPIEKHREAHGDAMAKCVIVQ